MAPVMAAALCSQLPPAPQGKLSPTLEKKKVTGKKNPNNDKTIHYPGSRAVKIKLRVVRGLIQLFPNWLQASAGLIKYLIWTWLLWTQPSAGYT